MGLIKGIILILSGVILLTKVAEKISKLDSDDFIIEKLNRKEALVLKYFYNTDLCLQNLVSKICHRKYANVEFVSGEVCSDGVIFTTSEKDVLSFFMRFKNLEDTPNNNEIDKNLLLEYYNETLVDLESRGIIHDNKFRRYVKLELERTFNRFFVIALGVGAVVKILGESFYGIIGAVLMFRVLIFVAKVDCESKIVTKKGQASLNAFELH